MDTQTIEARTVVQSLLKERASGATICPSEAARALACDDGDWRARMPVIHAAVDSMVSEGTIHLSWKGHALRERQGPYRIALAPFNRART